MSKIAPQFCTVIFKQGVLPPTEKLAMPIFPTPAGPVKSPLIRRFGLEPQWVRTLSTHAIASQAQSRCLNGNLTRLDSAALPRAVFLNLVTVNRFLITAKVASRLLRVEFGDRRIGKANRRKGQRPFFIVFRSERQRASV